MLPQLNWTALQQLLQKRFKMLVGRKIVSSVSKLVLHFAPGIRFLMLLLHVFVYFAACHSQLSRAILWLLLSQPLLNISIHTCKPSEENTGNEFQLAENICCKYH